MVDIRPFKGISYNPKKVNLSSVISPPYDVISPAGQESYYHQDEHNIIRVILGKEYADDSQLNNKYTRARNYLSKWIQEEALQQDDHEAIYVYRQTFSAMDKMCSLTGIVALVRLEELGKGNILPHEETLSAPKLDRLKLMDACEGNPELIYSLYTDETCQMNEILTRVASDIVPFIDFKDENGRGQQVWQITDDSQITQIMEIMKNKPVFIADGHHRYEATFRLKAERSIREGVNGQGSGVRSDEPTVAGEIIPVAISGDKPYDYIMMLLVAMDDPGLIILPTYRLVKGIQSYSPGLILEGLKETFEIRQCSKDEMFGVIESKRYAFGMYTQSGFYLLRLKQGVVNDRVMDGKSMEYQSLDVVVLHLLVINKLFNGYPEEGNIAYIKDKQGAIDSVDKGEYQLALFLAPASLSQLKTLSLNQEKMPQKSTYFWPKPVSGLLLYLW
ncbi:MAG: DUF1015 domain-containing protein [Candidatus Desantisbacteria bacterium]